MRSRMGRVGAAAALAVLAGSAASACGFYFPWQMLAAREQTMRDLPVDSFAHAAEHLAGRSEPRLPPARAFALGEATPDVASEERRLLDAAQQAQVAAMRAQPTAAAALVQGEGLPEAVRDYVAGAVAFRHGDLAGAVPLFRVALETTAHPPVAPQAVWAAYMLGRTLAGLGDDAGAVAAFRRTRALVALGEVDLRAGLLTPPRRMPPPVTGGVPDPLELGLASLGEEARVSLAASGLVVRLPEIPGPFPPSAPPAATGLAALDAAVTLYAQQAAQGEGWGVDSLQLVAEALISDPRWLAAAMERPLPRGLVVAYALASTGYAPSGGDGDPHTGAGDNLQGYGTFTTNMPATVAATDVLDRVAAAFRDGSLAGPVGDSRLAALAYLRGRYDLAALFANGATGPLAAWVRAKLTLQRGDPAATAAAFSEAVRTLDGDRLPSPPGQPWWRGEMTGRMADRLRAEPAVLAVARGDFELALRILYAAPPTYWADVSYLAERVLTTDELRRFVARHVASVPVLPASARPGDLQVVSLDPYDATEDPYPHIPFDRARVLRDLLARRLVRDGRLREAAETFTYADLAREAATYDTALGRSRTAFWRTDRARAAWDAAVIARRDGMVLMGTAMAPDQELLDGSYPGTLGSSAAPDGPFTTGAERRRFDASRPRPDLRFHYRYVAVDHAVRAASQLPPRSQAYAAVLCRASEWMFQTDDRGAARDLYRDYVRVGAVVPFATRFGHRCPDPDFAEASLARWALPLRHATGPMARHWHATASLMVIVLAGGVAFLVLRRRRPTA